MELKKSVVSTRNTKQSADFFCATTSFLVSATLNATAISPIEITLSSGAGSNFITTSIGQTAIVEYKIQDMIGRLPARTWLWSTPIPPYVTQTQSLHQPDCSSYNQDPTNPNSFRLPPNEFCYFAMQVDGTELANYYQGSTISYRPLFTNSNSVAYGPCPPEMLYMTLVPLPILPLLIGAGSYTDTTTTLRPLLLESANSGATWDYPQSANTPLFALGSGGAAFYGSSCSPTTAVCIAVGAGEDTNFNYRPILDLTQNSGNTWNYLPIDPPWFDPNTSFYFGGFNAASCSGNVCVAAGNDGSPLVAVSQDSGTTWNFPLSIHTPVFTPPNTNPYGSSGILISTSCSGQICIAVGNYTDTNNTSRPLLAVSQDSGTTWTYPDSITSPALTTNPYASDGLFHSASCSGSTCIAVGSYTDTNSLQRPLLALSQDSGNTWTYNDSITDPSSGANIYSNYGNLVTASCYGATCIAGGAYLDANNRVRNTLAVSMDSGASWSYPASIQSVSGLYDFFAPWGGVLGTNCYGNLCVAVGNVAGANMAPFVAVSQDAGATWAYDASMYTPVLSTNIYQSGGVLNSVTCNASACIASGRYISNSPGFRPLVALGLNNGSNWSYVDSVTSPVFTPTNTNPFSSDGRLPTTGASWVDFLKNVPAWVVPLKK